MQYIGNAAAAIVERCAEDAVICPRDSALLLRVMKKGWIFLIRGSCEDKLIPSNPFGYNAWI